MKSNRESARHIVSFFRLETELVEIKLEEICAWFNFESDETNLVTATAIVWKLRMWRQCEGTSNEIE